MSSPNFFIELKRHNVIRMAGLYLVGAWLLVQPMFGAPDWLARSIVILLAIGFVAALIFSRVFELTPQGLKRDEDVRPKESIALQTARRMIIAVLVNPRVLAWIAAQIEESLFVSAITVGDLRHGSLLLDHGKKEKRCCAGLKPG